jgi:hypothetical protein
VLHPTLGWGEQKGLGIDAMHLAINSFLTATGEINQSLCFSVVCAAGIEHNDLVAFRRLDQDLGVNQLLRTEHQ